MRYYYRRSIVVFPFLSYPTPEKPKTPINIVPGTGHALLASALLAGSMRRVTLARHRLAVLEMARFRACGVGCSGFG